MPLKRRLFVEILHRPHFQPPNRDKDSLVTFDHRDSEASSMPNTSARNPLFPALRSGQRLFRILPPKANLAIILLQAPPHSLSLALSISPSDAQLIAEKLNIPQTRMALS